MGDVTVEHIGAGSIGIGIPDGQTGPTDGGYPVGQPVSPRLTGDFQGPPPSNSVFTSLDYPQNGPFSAVMTADPLSVQTQAHGLDVGYDDAVMVSPDSYN